MWKLVLPAALLYWLFGDRLRLFAPHWRTVAAAGAGAVMGVFYAGLLARFGVLAQAGRALGIGPKGFGLIVVGFSAFMGARTFGPILRSMFPGRKDKDQ